MIGRDAAAIAADEAHHRASIALPVVVEEIADDQSQVMQVPVQVLQVVHSLQHHMPESLYQCRLMWWTLSGIDPVAWIAEVVGVCVLAPKFGMFGVSGDDLNRLPARIGQSDGDAAQSVRQSVHVLVGGLGEPDDVGILGSCERCTDETGSLSASDDHAR